MEVHRILSWKNAVFILTRGVHQLNFEIGIIDSCYFAKCCGDDKRQKKVIQQLRYVVKTNTSDFARFKLETDKEHEQGLALYMEPKG